MKNCISTSFVEWSFGWHFHRVWGFFPFFVWLKSCLQSSSYQLAACPLCVFACLRKDYATVCDFWTPLGSLGWQPLAKNSALNTSAPGGRLGCELPSADRFHESTVSSYPSQTSSVSKTQVWSHHMDNSAFHKEFASDAHADSLRKDTKRTSCSNLVHKNALKHSQSHVALGIWCFLLISHATVRGATAG